MAAETARQHIARVATENGWTAQTCDASSRTTAYQRGDYVVTVLFSIGGRVISGERLRDGYAANLTDKRNRRETVIGWLTEATEQQQLCAEQGHAVHKVDGIASGVCPRCGDVVSPAAEQTAADVIAGRDDVIGTPRTADGVAAVELLASHRLVGWVDEQGRLLTSLPELPDEDPVIVPAPVVHSYIDAIAGIPGAHHIRQDERADVALGLLEQAEAEREDAEQAAAGTYATLDEAEAGQPRASVERLRELAQTTAGSTAHVDVLARDHARIVLARLDEMEAQVAERAAERDEARESWLEAAVDVFRPRFAEVGYPLPERIHVSIGFPYGRAPENKVILGETTSTQVSKDGVNHVFISPITGDPAEVLRILLHELIHVALDNADDPAWAKHTGGFAEIATRLGFIGKMTETPVGPELAFEFVVLAAELGDFSHGAIDMHALRPAKSPRSVPAGAPAPRVSSGPAPQQNRYVKVVCRNEQCAGCSEYTARLSRKWIDVGTPGCGICGQPMDVA